MPNEEYRRFSGEVRNLKQKNEFLFDVEIWALNPEVNRNDWQFTDMDGNKAQFCGTPILIAYVGNKIGDGHNSTKKINKAGKQYLSFTGANDQRIIGAFSDNPDDIRIEKDANGTEWIVGKGTIWKWYAAEATEKIIADSNAGKPMSVSIEALIAECHMDGKVEVEDKYKILGTTILGDGVSPAVAGAHIAALSQLESDFKELKLKAASYIEPEGEKEKLSGEKKPQNKKLKKENAELKAFSKKQLAMLSAKFTGYNVLAAGQDENGIHVCLMSADGGTAVYTMGSTNDAVVPEKIERNNAQVLFEFGEEAVRVDSCEMTDILSASLIKTNSDVEALKKSLESATKTIESMKDKEQKRRTAAAKAKALSVLATFNANREAKMSDEAIKHIVLKAENGEYNACEDKDGNWTGEAEVEKDVLAKCASEQMELDKKEKERRNSVNVWNAYKDKDGNVNTGIESLIEKFGR